MATDLYLGLDCGGSTTRALVINGAGDTVFEGRSGAANLASTPIETLTLHLLEATHGCPPVKAACGCFAGLLTAQDEIRAAKILQSILETATVSARPDYYATLAACPTGTTACVIAGTGSLIASKVKGQVLKSGGGGPLLGDDGSAFMLGREALRMLQREGAVPTDARLLQGLKFEFGNADLSIVQAAIYESPSPAARVASLAPFVVADFLDERTYAAEVVSSANRHLVLLIAQHLQKHHPDLMDYQIAMAGGVWLIDDRYTTYFCETVKAELARALDLKGTILIEPLVDPPVLGACRIAMQMS